MDDQSKKAFTLIVNGNARTLETQCGISKAFLPTTGYYKAIWDTGATGLVISSKVVKELNLKPTGLQYVQTASGVDLMAKFIVNVFLPNGVAVTGVTGTEGRMGGTDILIGMTIINNGDFAITHKDGNTIFTFQIPSTHHIDFVKEGMTSDKYDT